MPSAGSATKQKATSSVRFQAGTRMGDAAPCAGGAEGSAASAIGREVEQGSTVVPLATLRAWVVPGGVNEHRVICGSLFMRIVFKAGRALRRGAAEKSAGADESGYQRKGTRRRLRLLWGLNLFNGGPAAMGP